MHRVSQISQYTQNSTSSGQYKTSYLFLSLSIFLNKTFRNKMDDFINVMKKSPKVQIKIKDMLDKCNRLPYNCESKIGYDTLIQNVLLKELKT